MKKLYVLGLLVGAVFLAGCQGEPPVNKADSMEQTLREAQQNAGQQNAPPYRPKGSGAKAGDTPIGAPSGTGSTK